MELTAHHFIQELKKLQSDGELEKIQRYFKSGTSKNDQFIGVKMGDVFKLAKQYVDMPLNEIEKLLESPIHEVRAGAISIMDKSSRSKKVTPQRHEELFKLYLRRHDRINNWDLVDLGSLYLVGSYLLDKPRDLLYELAASKNTWERRTAIVGTAHLIRNEALDDTFKIAEILVNDDEDLIHKAVGWMLRFAGDKDQNRLIKFLDKHAATMPRTMLRASIEKFDKNLKSHYMNIHK